MKELISCIKNFPRHFIAAVQNVWRNGVMSFSSIFAVTITLALIGVVSVLALNIQDITTNIESGVRIHVKLERDIPTEEEQAIGEKIKAINNVATATYSSKDQELTKLIDGYPDGGELFETYREDPPMGAAYIVEVSDAKFIKQVATEIQGIVNVNKATYGGSSTNDMIKTLDMVRTGGSIFIVGLVVVAVFMIANTIKITITSRQTEVSIMRMVGASNWYIRIPFMLEGMLIGLFGSLIPIFVVIYGYSMMYDMTGGMIASSMLSLIKPYPFIRDFSLILAGLGSGVGLIGSFVSIRRFLKF